MDAGITSDRRLEIRRTPQALAESAAELFAEIADHAILQRGSFQVALSGGSTPKLLYRVLAGDEYRGRIDWADVHVYFSDERFVPPDSDESNFHTASLGLLSKVPIPESHIHLVPTTDVEPAEAADIYERTIRDGVPGEDMPKFDLIFLGMGPDGHTASLFPETEALRVQDRFVVPNFVPKLNSWRITFTYPLINAAHTVAFLVAGDDKSGPVRDIVAGQDYPAGRVRPGDGRLVWFLDQSAASKLRSR